MSAITLITEVPPYITPDEHRAQTSSTPDSFSSILPVVRHTQSSVSVKIESAVLDLSSEELKDGTLYVIESALVWFSDAISKGFTVPYPNITLHAISRSELGPSLYCQIDQSLASNVQNGMIPENEEDEAPMVEMILIPTDPNSLENIFQALSSCASLHPDPATASDMDDDAFIDSSNTEFEVFDGTAEQELSEVGRAALEHLESIIQYSPAVARPESEDNERSPGLSEDQEHPTLNGHQ